MAPLQKKGHPDVVKIPGCELWLDLVRNYNKEKSFYLVGGTQEVIENTVKKLKNDFPEITITNFRNGYLKTEKEEFDLITDILKHQPDIVLVAMGSPKQELLMERIQKEHQATYQGLGGSFDVYTGHVKRAPKWWVKNNLEWFLCYFSKLILFIRLSNRLNCSTIINHNNFETIRC